MGEPCATVQPNEARLGNRCDPAGLLLRLASHKRSVLLYFLVVLALPTSAYCQPDGFPIVPEDVEVVLFAKEPLVRNPCAITFDARGRLCVGMGPQYRNPKRETPGDSVWILLDEDRDGVADGRKEFASGFNAIQGLAWRGRDLWAT